MTEYYLPYEAYAGKQSTRNPRDISFNQRLFQEVAFIANISQKMNHLGLSEAKQIILHAMCKRESFPEICRLSQYSRAERMVREHRDYYFSLKEKFPNGWEDDSN